MGEAGRGVEPPIRVMLVDDEPWALANLRALLARDPSVVVVGESLSGEQALTDIRELQPDLLFLDVQMPECDGFSMLEQLGPAAPPALVFVTAHDRYALQAFDAAAVDYLLKPFDCERFERALQRGKERLARRRTQVEDSARWLVRNGGEWLFVDPSDIDWIEAADYYACLHVGPRSHMLRRSIADLAASLDPGRFCRIHRSVIVNLARVASLGLGADGGSVVLMKDGRSLPLSRRYGRELRARFSDLAKTSGRDDSFLPGAWQAR